MEDRHPVSTKVYVCSFMSRDKLEHTNYLGNPRGPLFDCTLIAVRAADPEGELTNLRKSAKSSKIIRSARFVVHEVKPFHLHTFKIESDNLRQGAQTSASFRKTTFQTLAIKMEFCAH